MLTLRFLTKIKPNQRQNLCVRPISLPRLPVLSPTHFRLAPAFVLQPSRPFSSNEPKAENKSETEKEKGSDQENDKQDKQKKGSDKEDKNPSSQSTPSGMGLVALTLLILGYASLTSPDIVMRSENKIDFSDFENMLEDERVAKLEVINNKNVLVFSRTLR
eukprot:TRINITY_DN10342_c0_g1_i1.p1 TRINITY_DN10342_c0_g1~~TRINITY_DN10342_c0_g1_i1.p1  ORF type:complete len:161 (-),score=23.81 TRINITY_DN10342_c0_g1_i1:3-485(-)